MHGICFEYIGNPCHRFDRTDEFDAGYFLWNSTCYGMTTRNLHERLTAVNFCEVRDSDLLYIESADKLRAVSRWMSSLVNDGVRTGGYRRRTTSSTWYWTTRRGGKLPLLHSKPV